MTAGSTLRAALEDVRVRDLMEAWGEAYSWGEGEPWTPWLNGEDGYDCSGFAQAALVRLGLLSAKSPDRSAYGLANVCDPIKPGDERLGDLAFYGSPVHHVMVVIAPGIVLGARGGGSTTKGDDERAYVSLLPLHYRPLTVIGRIRKGV
jgi:cell wall-associated NlpC family hydrolase